MNQEDQVLVVDPDCQDGMEVLVHKVQLEVPVFQDCLEKLVYLDDKVLLVSLVKLADLVMLENVESQVNLVLMV